MTHETREHETRELDESVVVRVPGVTREGKVRKKNVSDPEDMLRVVIDTQEHRGFATDPAAPSDDSARIERTVQAVQRRNEILTA